MIAFVGNVFPGERQRLLDEIQQRNLKSFIGNRLFDAMDETYSTSKIVFNQSLRDDINMRVFEGLCNLALRAVCDRLGI